MVLLLAVGVSSAGCGGGGAASVPPPPPPPPSINVKVAPAIGTVLLGNTQIFSAEVLNTTNTNVTWSVNGIPNGNVLVGVISATGVYTAPADLPGNLSVQVTATSVADATKSNSAQITLASDISIALAPGAANVELGAGLRVLYPDSADTEHVGSIQGRILPANPLSLPVSPQGVTGLFGTHVAAVDAATGNVIAGTLGGWSCTSPGPAQFDGSYLFQSLPIGHSYQVYAEALNGAVDPSQASNAMSTLCRNPTTDAGWPPLSSCVVPPASTSFTVRVRPSP